MTQEEMNLVINAAINFGMNNDMSGELHEVKQHNLELMIENKRLQENEGILREKIGSLQTAYNSLLKNERNVFMDIKNVTPVDQHLYLCIVDYDPTTVLCRNNLRLLFYEKDKHKWKDIDGDAFDYSDVSFFARIDSDNFIYD